jgi:hypothetical protein
MGGPLWTSKFIACWVLVIIPLLVSAIIFIVFKFRVDAAVDDAAELCDKDWVNYDYFTNPPTQTMTTYVFNISNPAEYLDGGEAQLHEKGPYQFDLDINREEVVFHDDRKVVDYTLLNYLDFQEDKQCVGCEHVFKEKVTVINPAYAALLAGSQSEATLLMSLACSSTQIGLMAIMNPYPYCEKTEIGPSSSTLCRCCVPPVDGFVAVGLPASEYENNDWSFCKDITNPQGASAGVLGYVGKYDGAYKIRDTLQAFPLSTGTYTNYLRTYSVSELLTGSMSAFMGFVGYAALSQQLGNPVAKLQYDGIVNATQDMKDVCYSSNYNFCPQVSQVLATMSAIMGPTPQATAGLRLAYLKTVNCSGSIPAYQDLMDTGGLSEERALQLRYLEGLPCDSFTPAIAFATLIQSSMANSGTCADGTTNFPCCLSTFSLNFPTGVFAGRGMGCLRFIDGVIQKKRVYSAEEARLDLGNTVRQKTVCNSQDKLQLLEWFGKTSFDEWFTPAAYTFGGMFPMPWADPTVIKNANTSIAGTFTGVVVADGRAVTQTVGNGAGKSFLVSDLSDGDVKEKEWQLYATNLQRIRTAEFIKNEDKFDLQTAKYQIKQEFGDEDAATDASERSGQMPYPNIINLIYTERGKPAILTNPNFLDVNEAMFTQGNNQKRQYANGVGGVTLHKTRSAYSWNAAEIAPEQMSKASVNENRGTFESYWNYEPATGLTVTNQVTGMFGLFTMNCNPLFDPFCSVKAGYDLDLCYPRKDSNDTDYTLPCSNTNVLTPKVQGEKIFPVYWNSVIASPPQSAIDKAIFLLDVRFGFSILCVIFPCLFFILLVYTCFTWKASDTAIPAVPVMSGEHVEIAKDEAPTEGDVALTNIVSGEDTL